jgi:tRNA A37 N6-isopentenylltransferase MiaA
VTAAHDYDDLHHLVDRLTERQAERLRVLVSSDPELASATEPENEQTAQRRLSIIGIWESGRGDLSERHDEIIRGRLKRPA